LPVVAPAVVGATDTLLLDSSILQRRSSMRTVTTQQRRVARDCAKKDELLSECFHGHGMSLLPRRAMATRTA
jgi:hypothetical protein